MHHFIFLFLQTNIAADHESEKGYYKLKVICFAYLIAFSDLVVEPVHPHLPRPLRRLTTNSLLVLL